MNYKVSANPCLSAHGGEELEIFLTPHSKKLLESAVEEPKRRIDAPLEDSAAAADAESTTDLASTVDETLEKSIKRKRDADFAAAANSSKKSAKMMDLRLDRKSPSVRPLDASLASLSRRLSVEKNVMDDYEKWLTAAAAVPLPTSPVIWTTEVDSKNLEEELRSSFGEIRRSIGEKRRSNGEKRPSLGEKRPSIGEKRHSTGEKRRSTGASIGEAPVSFLLDTLKQEVEAAKLRDKMFEIDLMNMVASDDII